MSLQTSAPSGEAWAEELERVPPIGGGDASDKPAAIARPSGSPARAIEARSTILTGPVLPTLLRLALPTMTVLIAQTAVNIAEAYYVGYLGTDALAEIGRAHV